MKKTALSIIFFLTIFAAVGCAESSSFSKEMSYTLFVRIDESNAKDRINAIMTEKEITFTLIEADGAFVDGKGNVIESGTLVYYCDECSEKTIDSAVSEIREILSPPSIYVQRKEVEYKYYNKSE